MLHFNYTLDNELRTRVGELPSGIQTQAFEMALYRLVPRYERIKRMLTQVTPTGVSTLDGLNKKWQERLRAEAAFVGKLPSRMLKMAGKVAGGDTMDALIQSKLSQNWNGWAPEALKLYAKVVAAFEKDVNKAVSNEPSMTVDESFRQIAAFLLLPAAPGFPAVPPASLNGLGALDPDYLAGVQIFGREFSGVQIAGMGLLAVVGGMLLLRNREDELGYYW